MIFDLLTSPQGHKFDPRIFFLFAFCSGCHPFRFDMLHDYVLNFFLIPWPPQRPKVPPLGLDPGDRMKILSDMRTQIQFGIKIFEIDMETEI